MALSDEPGRPNDKLEGMQTEVLVLCFKVALWSFNDDNV
jgi:hypothetical protein